MIGYLIDVRKDRVGPVVIGERNRLDQLYNLIGCRCIDVVMRKIGDKAYNVVLDDEGLFVSDQTVSAIGPDMEAMLVGNLVIFDVGEEMDLASISVEDIANIEGNLYGAVDFDRMKVHPVVAMSY